MAYGKPPAVVPWSYSSLTAYETCPRRFYLTKVTKQVTEPQTEATMHGNEVHKALELATKGERQLPEKYAQYHPIVMRLRDRPGKKLIEYKFGLTRTFKPTEFFGKDVWVRGVFDYGCLQETTGVILDHKTGKPKTDADQLRLFAGVALSAFPYLESVKTGYLWLAHNKVDSETFTRDDLPDIWQDFSMRVRRMEISLRDDDFPPNPSGLCRAWCPVGKRLCEFCGKD